MATSSNDLTTLDFNSIKENLKTYLKSQDIFKDYDFEASNINVLLDVLAYNTNLNSFYLNMIANEMFLDSAVLRDSIVSHAKELGYIPRSFRSARAKINIELLDNTENSTVLIPRGTTFTGRSDNKNFTFTTSENVQAQSQGDNKFLATDVIIREGDYVQDSYVTGQNIRYIVTNKTVDINSIKLIVIEDNGAAALTYERRDSLFGIGASDQVFFIQAAENDTYEILFGDGIIGRTPKNNSIVLIEYRASNGELPNGIGVFSADDDIGSAVVTKITTIDKASGGAVNESLESIKFNAPRAFTTQERVVTAQDYSTALKAQFSEINDVAAYGGELSDPPRFGKVIVAVDLKNTDDLPDLNRAIYADYIRARSPLSIDPIFVTPNYLYLSINTKVKYNISQTSLGVDDIQSLVVSAIQTFNENNLNGFDKTLRYSKLIAAIDNAQVAIISNDTDVKATQFLPLSLEGSRSSYVVEFDMALMKEDRAHAVRSGIFQFSGKSCFMGDNPEDSTLQIFEEDTFDVIATIGTVDYELGTIRIDNFATDNLDANLKFTVVPIEKDIAAIKRSILRVLDDDITVQVEQVRI
jgi:hypothetical protein